MTEQELTHFKKLLVERRDQILSGLKHIADDHLNKSPREAAGDLSGYAYHMADMASDTYNREFSLNLASGEREILLSIDEALERIEEKNYGNCLSCSNPITGQRLEAIPYAKYCIECQKKEERQRRR